MNDRFIRKNVYQVGLSYQIDSFNPIFLDKTGQLIALSEGKLINWNGGIDGFQFATKDQTVNGKVSMHNYWYGFAKQGDFDEKSLLNFLSFISETNKLISSVYNPTHFKRIGLRTQYILKKTTSKIKSTYDDFYNGKFSCFEKYGQLHTSSIGFEIQNTFANIKVNIAYAVRQGDNDQNAPQNGLLIDIDFYKQLEKIGPDKIDEVNSELLSYTSDNYKEIIYNIALQMGAANED